MKYDAFGQTYTTTQELCDLLYVNPDLDLTKFKLEDPEQYNKAIRSLYLLGNEQIAAKLCDFLVAAVRETGMVSDKTVEYWRNALKG